MKMEKDLDFPFSLCWNVKAAWYAQAKLLGVCTLSRPEIGSAAAATATPTCPSLPPAALQPHSQWGKALLPHWSPFHSKLTLTFLTATGFLRFSSTVTWSIFLTFDFSAPVYSSIQSKFKLDSVVWILLHVLEFFLSFFTCTAFFWGNHRSESKSNKLAQYQFIYMI